MKVRCYYRDNGKLACVDIDNVESYRQALWNVRKMVFGEKEMWFEVKSSVMALIK